jgi:hypothetical protein
VIWRSRLALICAALGAIGPTSREAAGVLPTLLDAVTTTRTRAPTSAARSVYEEPVAPAMLTHEKPHRCHRSANDSGAVPDHVPVEADSDRPTVVVPVITGNDSFEGFVARLTTPLAAELDGALEPPAFEAVSVTRIV